MGGLRRKEAREEEEFKRKLFIKIKMEIILNKDNNLMIRMDANYTLANALRRSADEIPTLAVDEVEIFKNDSALYDETLAHRIGLVPLKTDKKMGEKTSIQLKLVKSSPGWVYSGDLKGNKVVYDKMPLTLLEKGQEIELVATAKLGKGSEHSKHSPGLIYYKDLYEIKSSKQDVEKIIENSKGLIKPEKKGTGWVCDLNDSELEEIQEKDKEAVKESGEIILVVESWGNFSAEDLLLNAIEALSENLTEFEKSVKS